jgi:hypothetical protein
MIKIHLRQLQPQSFFIFTKRLTKTHHYYQRHTGIENSERTSKINFDIVDKFNFS